MEEGVWYPGGAAIEKPHKVRLGIMDYFLFLMSGVIMALGLLIFFWLVGAAA